MGMKLKNNQSGAAHIVVILLVIVIAIVGVVGWKVWDNSKTKSDSTPKAQDKTQQTSDNSSDSTKSYLEIAQWGIKFEVPSEVSDLKVDKITDFSADESRPESSSAILDSPALEAAGKIKTTGTQERHEKLGYIVRQKCGTSYIGDKTIDDFIDGSAYSGAKADGYCYLYITTYAADNSEVYTNAIKTVIESSLVGTN